MKISQSRSSMIGVTVSIVIIGALLIGLTGCLKKAAPDVTDTPAGGAQAEQPTATPDLMATAAYNSTVAAGGVTERPTESSNVPVTTPTSPPPTPTQPSMPVITAAPTFTPAPEVATTPTTIPATGTVMHTVQPGENLFRISLRYNTTVEAIARVNNIANPAMIYVGQVLTIPTSEAPSSPEGETSYVVQPGDNLFRIALRYNMSYITLASYNNIANPATIYVGQVLRIPSLQ